MLIKLIRTLLRNFFFIKQTKQNMYSKSAALEFCYILIFLIFSFFSLFALIHASVAYLLFLILCCICFAVINYVHCSCKERT